MERSTPTPPYATSSKLRLMCSYGGHVVPRPHTKSLFYSGGETRIVSIPAAATLSSLVDHLSAVLSVSAAFNLKYQLPGHDLDSLISLSTDDDLLIMLEEVQRLSPPSRIRLFLFPAKSVHAETTPPESTQCQSVLCHPKTETWFIDALNSARMMQKGDNSAAGFGQNEALSGGAVVSTAESIVLETNSSFGSTSSSVSLTNLPSTKAQEEDAGFSGLQENKTRSPTQDSVPRGTPNAIHHPQTGLYHEQVVSVASTGTGASPILHESEDKGLVPSLGIPSHPTVPISGFPVSMHYDQHQQQQQRHQFVYSGTPYMSQQPICLVPVSSTGQPMYQWQPQPLYHPNQPHPMYVMPSAPPQPYGLSMQCGLADTRNVVNFPSFHPSGNPPPLHHIIPKVPPHEYSREASTPCKQELGTVHVAPLNSNLPQGGPSGDIDQRESSSPLNEFEDDPARVQIYKSQPPLPTLSAQHQTMTKTTAMLLSEALTQLHTNVPGNRS